MSEHVAEDILQRFADRELGSSDGDAVGRHVATCADCGARLESITRAGVAYLEYHHNTLKAQDPAPPRPWEDLRPRLKPAVVSIPRVPGGSWRGWLAAAAVLLAAVAAYYRINRVAPVSAAELLRKAAAVEVASDPGRGIFLRANGRRLVRPAVLSGSRPALAEPQLEAMFLAAHFSWKDPLSARSFAQWRDQLPQKEDRVRVAEGSYEIHTTTRSGPLSDAILVLDARDLHAMSETLQFADALVQIAEAELVAVATPPAPSAARTESPSLPSAPPSPGATDELRVVAALHAIGADLGDPVQVTRRDGSLVVEATGLTPARQQQVRDAVAPIPGVILRFDVPDASPADPAPAGRSATATAAGVRTQLEAILGEDGVNRILDASEAVMARAYALRSLSRRFPQTVEAQLADADRGVLAAIRGEHVSGIRTHLPSLRSAVAPLLPKVPPAETPAPANWQVRAGRIFTAALQVDQLLNRILAGGEDFTQRAPELAEALRQLDAEAAAETRP